MMCHEHPHDCGPGRPRRFITHLGLGLLIGGALALGFGGLVMWLWNQILPDLTGWGRLSFLQAVGLLVLARILFGGHGRHVARHFRHHWATREAGRPDGTAC